MLTYCFLCAKHVSYSFFYFLLNEIILSFRGKSDGTKRHGTLPLLIINNFKIVAFASYYFNALISKISEVLVLMYK